jgi:aspartate-semialdehyde dehydrogenase
MHYFLPNTGITLGFKDMSKPKSVAIVGATGIVGRELIALLEERKFPVSSLKLLASADSAGQTIEFRGDEIAIEELDASSFEDVDLAFFATSAAIAKEYCPIAVRAGALCIDKSSAHRMDPAVPLVVPDVNAKAIAQFKKKGIIASPNCVAAPLVQVLWPLHKQFGLKRAIVCSYQSVSGAGQKGVAELESQVRDLFNLRQPKTEVFGGRIAFNVLPCIPAEGNFNDEGYTEEESKGIEESRRILDLPELPISFTCVRVPVFSGHSMAIHAEFEREPTALEARTILENASSIDVLDDKDGPHYPTPVESTGKDVTLVGRIRKDTGLKNGLALFACSDNLRTGAALNAIRIAEIVVSEYNL